MPEQTEAALAVCERCEGKGTEIDLGDGGAERECSACDGTGQVAAASSSCPECGAPSGVRCNEDDRGRCVGQAEVSSVKTTNGGTT